MNTILITLFISTILGLIIASSYIFINKQTNSKDFSLTLLLLPILISVIIITVGTNIAGAFSMAGIFSIVRFRSAPGNPKDITYILFTVAAGLLVSTNSYLAAFVVTIFVCLITFVIHLFSNNGNSNLRLKILIPEDLNFEEVFDVVLSHYTISYNNTAIKTRDLGSVYELTYEITISDKINRKEMIDDLRIRNGNLNITLTKNEVYGF